MSQLQNVGDAATKTSVKVLRETPAKYQPAHHINNLREEKENFLKFGKIPKFKFGRAVDWSGRNKKKTEIRFDFLLEARNILERVREIFGSGDNYMQAAFGGRITRPEANREVLEYVNSHGLDGSLSVFWTDDLNCSGRMLWQGPSVRYNKPEARKFTLWLKRSTDNSYLREYGIKSLMDHEIGTHFLRAMNDGLQPWFSNRKRFDLRVPNSYSGMVNEEGLAAINTLFQAQVKMLFIPALLYYTACMSAEMTFKELFEHLETYVFDKDQRWNYVMRVKRSLQDCNKVGGCGVDQCYFEGAVMILRRMNEIDFKLYHSGKICFDELQRVRRIARQDCVKLPHFLKDVVSYKKALREIAVMNGLIQLVDRPLQSRNNSRPTGKKKRARGPSENRVQSRLYSPQARSKSGLPYVTPRQPRILHRRSSLYKHLCTSVSSLAPLSGVSEGNFGRKGWV